jgi:hypothetical protein
MVTPEATCVSCGNFLNSCGGGIDHKAMRTVFFGMIDGG